MKHMKFDSSMTLEDFFHRYLCGYYDNATNEELHEMVRRLAKLGINLKSRLEDRIERYNSPFWQRLTQ